MYVYADYSLGTIWGFRFKNGRITDRATLLQQPKNIGSFSEDIAGELYALTIDGKILAVAVADGAR